MTLFHIAVYRHYDATGRLLYVGQCRDPYARMKQHRIKRQPWVDDVARTDVVWFDNRIDALRAERRATRTEGPLHPSDVESGKCVSLAIAQIAADLRSNGYSRTEARGLAAEIVHESGYAAGDDRPRVEPVADDVYQAHQLQRVVEALEGLGELLMPRAS